MLSKLTKHVCTMFGLRDSEILFTTNMVITVLLHLLLEALLNKCVK